MKKAQHYDLKILTHIEENPDVTQAELASLLDVAVGSINWYIKRLISKGYLDVQQMQRRRLRYLITLAGSRYKAKLMAAFTQASLKWYRLTREASKKHLAAVKDAGYDTICIEGDGDLAEIVYLSCLEADISVTEAANSPQVPTVHIEGLQTRLDWPHDILSPTD